MNTTVLLQKVAKCQQRWQNSLRQAQIKFTATASLSSIISITPLLVMLLIMAQSFLEQHFKYIACGVEGKVMAKG